jgi:8-oxo-dGTP pyrophosphatase MutT (NUDIX family)
MTVSTSIISAGGILLKRENTENFLVIVEWEKGVEPKWAPVLRQLPKGGIEHGERLEQAALREVYEETGYKATIIGKAGVACWSYQRDGKMWDETVHYFFMVPTSLEPDQHDDEFDNIRWVYINEAASLLSYPPERQLITNIINNALIPTID